MAVTSRYHSWPPGEQAQIGMDFSNVIPAGLDLVAATLTILTNTSPALPQTDFVQSPVAFGERQAWCGISGGNSGTDYQCRWTVTDNLGNTWNRTALLLCAESS